MSDDKTEQIFVHLEYIKDAIDGVNDRLDGQSDRIRETEKAVVVLQWALGLLGAVSVVALFTIARQLWP